MLFNTLLMIVNMLVVIFMEKSTKNSRIPPSQTTEDQSSTSPGSNKKGQAQNDESFDNSRTFETETVAKVNRCSACAENLSQISVTDYERCTRIDIVFEKRVEHIDAWTAPPRSSAVRVVITSPRASFLPIWPALFSVDSVSKLSF